MARLVRRRPDWAWPARRSEAAQQDSFGDGLPPRCRRDGRAILARRAFREVVPCGGVGARALPFDMLASSLLFVENGQPPQRLRPSRPSALGRVTNPRKGCSYV
jgi:hypothetical protein